MRTEKRHFFKILYDSVPYNPEDLLYGLIPFVLTEAEAILRGTLCLVKMFDWMSLWIC